MEISFKHKSTSCVCLCFFFVLEDSNMDNKAFSDENENAGEQRESTEIQMQLRNEVTSSKTNLAKAIDGIEIEEDFPSKERG